MNNMRQKYPLTKQQEMCKNFVITHPRCGLFVPMGVGKTRITLEALAEINPHGHVLIIAPNVIAKSVWQNEIDKWGFPFRTQSLIVNERGNKLSLKKRHALYDKLLETPPTVYFLNRELVTDLVNNVPMYNKKPVWPFQTVIIDELQSFKSYDSQRFKALKKVQPCINRFIGLTGTPKPNSEMDLWPEIYLMDGGVRLGHNITAYRETFFNPGHVIVNGYPVTWTPKIGAVDEIYRRISDIVISVKSNGIKLPPLTIEDMPVTLSSSELRTYRDFKRTSVMNIDDAQIEAPNAAVLVAKLSQIASGAIYTDAKTHEYKRIHTKKLEMCHYICEDADSPVLIAYHFQSDKDMLLEYFKAHGINAQIFDKTAQMIDRWNKGEIPVMLIQPASAGFGLNLQEGGHTLIWYTIPWSLEEYLQTNARLYRTGQTKPTAIYHLVAENTIDRHILECLNRKDTSQTALLNAVRQDV